MLRRYIDRFLARLLPVIYVLRLLSWRILRPVTLGVRVVAIDGDRLLMVRAHGRRGWHLPGGAVGRRETLAEAARREVREETGCSVELERLLGMYASFDEYKSDHVAIFAGRPTSPIATKLNIEIAEARYFPLDALPKETEAYVHRRLAEYRAQGWSSHGAW